MCAIVDANVAGQVFGNCRPPAGEEFYKWLNAGKGRLVIGGKLLQELNKTKFRKWVSQARKFGFAREVDESQVERITAKLHDKQLCSSDDPHVIALAQASGARLLYSNDDALQSDFKNKDLIDDPRGKVYTTKKYSTITSTHKSLLRRKDLCRIP